MPLLIPSNQIRLEKIPHPDSKISNQEIEIRAACIASKWTCNHRSERKRLTDSPRPGRQLFDATMPFTEESPARSWWNVSSTLAILLALLVYAAVAPWWSLRLT
jgi:hypothetical protein